MHSMTVGSIVGVHQRLVQFNPGRSGRGDLVSSTCPTMSKRLVKIQPWFAWLGSGVFDDCEMFS